MFADDASKRALRIKQVLSNAYSVNPDKAAGIQDLSNATGLSQDTVKSSPATIGAFSKANRLDVASIMRSSPVLALQLTNPEFADISHDDISNLSALESTLAAPVKRLGGSTNDSALAVNRTLGLIPDLIDYITGATTAGDWWKQNMVTPLVSNEPAFALSKGAGIGEKLAGAVGDVAGIMSLATLTSPVGEAAIAEQGVKSIIESLSSSIPASVRTMIAPALTSAVNTSSDVYSATKDPVKAVKAFFAQAETTSAIGVVPLSAPGKVLTRLLGGASSGIAVGEGSRQVMNAFLPTGMNQPFSPDELLVSSLSGALLGGVMGPRAAGAERGLVNGYGNVSKAAQTADMVSRINEFAKASSLLKRSPEKFSDFIKNVTEEHGAPENLYIDTSALMQSGVADDVARVSPSVAEQLPMADASGGQLRIPVEEYASKIAPEEFSNDLIDHLKTDPEGFSLNEAKNYMQSGAGESLKADIKDAFDALNTSTEEASSVGVVHAEIMAQLADTGRFTPGVNTLYSTLVSNFYGTMASKLPGETAESVYKQYPLNIVAGEADGPGDRRGAFNPETLTVSLLKSADLSTFLHETGHFFLEAQFGVTRKMSDENAISGGTLSDGEKSIISDSQSVLNWLGVKNQAEWGDLSLEERRKYHEKFAKGFETYLFEGKSPSIVMHGVFQRFRSWLMSIYRSKKALGVSLSPEVRGVFDRMLATDDAIAQSESARSLGPLFSSPEHARDSGVDISNWSEYQAMGDTARADAIEELQGRGLRDMAWLQRARDRIIRDLQKTAKGQYDASVTEARKRVMDEPVYKAWSFLTAPVPRGDEAKAKKAGTYGRLDLESVIRMGLPDSEFARLKSAKMLRARAGLDPSIVADEYGFGSGEEMVRALADATPINDEIAAIADTIMMESHGDLNSRQAIETAANEAIHNSARARMVTTDANILAKAVGGKRILTSAANALAKTTIGGMKIADIVPAMYSSADARAGRAALKASKAGDMALAAKEKRNQVLSIALEKAAKDALETVNKLLTLQRKYDKKTVRKKMDPDILDQIDDLRDRFDFRKAPPRGPDKKHVQLVQWINAQKDAGYSPVEDISVMDAQVRQSYKDLTAGAISGLYDTLRSMERIARSRKTITIDGRKVEVKVAVAEMISKMRKRGDRFSDKRLAEQPRRRVDPAWRVALDRTLSFMRFTKAEALPQHFKANEYDKHQILGPFHKMIFEPVFKANYKWLDMRREVSNLFRDKAKSLGKDWQLSMSDVVEDHTLLDNSLEIPGKYRLTRGDLIGIALNVGNESNFDKLTRGMGWDGGDVWKTLDRNMREKDWQATRALADAAGAYWPQMEAMNRRLGNTSPEQVTPRPFMTRYGEMPGWYAPIRYDPSRSRLSIRKSANQAVNEKGELFNRDYYRADTTTNGSLNSRVAGYYDFIDLDWHATEKAISDTIRDLAYRETLLNSHKLIADRGFRRQFLRSYGKEEYDAIDRWLGLLVNDETRNETSSKILAIMKSTRRALVASGIAFRISTMLKHGASSGSKSLGYFAGGGEKHFLRRAKLIATNSEGEIESALAMFPEIRARWEQQDRDFRQTVSTMFDPESIRGKAERFGHAGVAYLDFLTAVPTAHAAYDWAISTGIPKRLGGTGEPMNEHDAIMYASSLVREAHGTNIESGRSNLINNPHEAVKMLTILYGFMNNSLGQQMDIINKFRTSGIGKPELVARAVMTMIVPALLIGYVLEGGPSEDEPWWEFAAKAIGSEYAATVPIIRDAYNYFIKGYQSTGLPPWFQTMGTFTRPVRILEGKNVKYPIKDIGNAAGLLLPGLSQAGATSQFIVDYARGKQEPETVSEWMRGIMKGSIKARK